MDKAKILRQCNEIERAVNELYVKQQDSITRDERIALINMLGVIVTEITALPKTNADRIRQMTDEELAAVLRCNSCLYQNMPECESSECKYGILAWLRKEVSEDAGTDD